ncbi:MAG: plastocyanin [Betaproteobacteria bacterium]|nr:plastocyanin [Betaproteobacteria bacterium]
MNRNVILAVVCAYCLNSGQVFAHDEKPGAKAAAAKGHASVHREQQAWGIAGDAKAARRTVEITMLDTMRFSPEKIEVRQGETVRFVVKNAGKQMHEMVIGTKKVLDEHAALMLKFPSMEHDEPHMAHVAAGKSADLIWQFNRAGDFDFACLIAGHYQAGMRGSIKVSSTAGKGK